MFRDTLNAILVSTFFCFSFEATNSHPQAALLSFGVLQLHIHVLGRGFHRPQHLQSAAPSPPPTTPETRSSFWTWPARPRQCQQRQRQRPLLHRAGCFALLPSDSEEGQCQEEDEPSAQCPHGAAQPLSPRAAALPQQQWHGLTRSIAIPPRKRKASRRPRLRLPAPGCLLSTRCFSIP